MWDYLQRLEMGGGKTPGHCGASGMCRCCVKVPVRELTDRACSGEDRGSRIRCERTALAGAASRVISSALECGGYALRWSLTDA